MATTGRERKAMAEAVTVLALTESLVNSTTSVCAKNDGLLDALEKALTRAGLPAGARVYGHYEAAKYLSHAGRNERALKHCDVALKVLAGNPGLVAEGVGSSTLRAERARILILLHRDGEASQELKHCIDLCLDARNYDELEHCVGLFTTACERRDKQARPAAPKGGAA